jgi:cell pole-organizing protein PopZ
MSQPAKVQEPSMEEILASIRRIIADDETKPATAGDNSAAAKSSPGPAASKGPSAASNPPAPPAPPAFKPAVAEKNSQDDIDALLAGLDSSTTEAEIRPAAPANDVLELTDDMALPDLPETTFQKVEPENDIEFTEVATERRRPSEPEEPLSAEPAPYREPMTSPSPQMLSQSTVSAVESAFNSLASTVLSNNARTLEDLVREMLRPMLKSWLDDNLPGLVERIVKAEIERVSRGR